MYQEGGSSSVDRCTFVGNQAAKGGAIALANCDIPLYESVEDGWTPNKVQHMSIQGSTFAGNVAADLGGAIAVAANDQDGCFSYDLCGGWCNDAVAYEDYITFKGVVIVLDSTFANNTVTRAVNADGTAAAVGTVFDIATHPSQGEILFDNCRVNVTDGSPATYAISASSVVVLRGRDGEGGFDWDQESWGQPNVTRVTTSACEANAPKAPPVLRRGSACPAYTTEATKFETDASTGRTVPQGIVCRECAAGTVPVAQPLPIFDANTTTLTNPAFPALNWACECPAGWGHTLASDGINAECTPCAAGTYSSHGTTAEEACLPCGTGQYQDEVGQAVCKTCPVGQHVSSTSGTGETSEHAACDPCSHGTFQDQPGRHDCKAAYECAQGTRVDVEHTSTTNRECAVCLEGRFSNTSNVLNCTACPVGQYQPDQKKVACVACAAGKFGNGTDTTTSAHCVACPAGQYQDSDTGHATCIASPECNDDYFETAELTPTSNRQCAAKSDCDTGTFCPISSDRCSGQEGCVACPVGRFSDDRGAVEQCRACQTGRFQDEPGQASCPYCPAGTANGARGSTTAGACAPCQFGRFASLGAPLCSTCPDNAQYPPNCPAGTYRSTTDMSCQCKACPGGRFNPQPATTTDGRIDCDACPAGQYASDTASPSPACTQCQLGKHTAGHDGQAFCTNCHAGMHGSRVEGVATCTECEAGQYQAIPAKTACNACACGTYTTSTGSPQCAPCDHASSAQSTCAGACASTPPSLPVLPAFAFADVTSSCVTVGTCLDALQTFQTDATEFGLGATHTTGAGWVSVDINHDGSVDTLDAITLFVAQTMQNFGATSVLAALYARAEWTGDRSIEQIIAEVSTAVDAASAV